MTNRLTITASTRIRELIDSYPELEDELVAMAPAFAKLKNPVLRNTIARVTTLSQAALIGDLKVNEMVNRLRLRAGQETQTVEEPDKAAVDGEAPDWFRADKIVASIDARPVLEAGQHPMEMVFSKLAGLDDGEILELINSFVPAPLITGAENKGYKVFVNQTADDVFLTYFCRVKR